MTLPAPTRPAPTPTHIARCVWPITDPTLGMGELIAQATADLPALLARHGARPHRASAGRFWVARSVDVPGSGCLTEHVLVFEGPANPDHTARPYRARLTRGGV